MANLRANPRANLRANLRPNLRANPRANLRAITWSDLRRGQGSGEKGDIRVVHRVAEG